MPVLDEATVLSALEESAFWPNLSEAAAIVGVNKSTLSKQANHGRIRYETRGLGQAQRILSPQEVLRIAWGYQRMPRPTAVERLSEFFARRINVDHDLIQRVLWRLAANTSGTAAGHANDKHGLGGSEPRWLQEWASLRASRSSVEATLFFTSPDDLIDTIHPGPFVDEVGAVTEVAWPAS